MPSLCTKHLGPNERNAIGSLGGRPPTALPDSGEVAAGVGGRGWGRPSGSPRARFGGSEGALEDRVGKLGGARRRPLRRRENPARPGRSQATRGGGSFHGVPGRFRVAGRRKNGGEGAVHRAATIVTGGGARSSGGHPSRRRAGLGVYKVAGRSYSTPLHARS
jgi:hypothetical protein